MIDTFIGLVTSEWFAVLTGIVTVFLAARNNVWNWPIGIVSSAAFAVLFFQNGLYADTSLQIFYVVIGFYGLWFWMRGGKDQKEAPVTYAGTRHLILTGILTLSGFGVIYLLLTSHTNSTVPIPDAATVAISLWAQYLLARRMVENWPIWIFGVNVPYFFLYIYKGLPLTAAMQVIFIVLSVMGWIRFRAEVKYREQVEGSWESIPA